MKIFLYICAISCLFFNNALGSNGPSLSFIKAKSIQQIFIAKPNTDLHDAIENNEIDKAKNIIEKWKNLDSETAVSLNINQYLRQACLKLQVTVIRAILEKAAAKTGKILTVDMIKALGVSHCIEDILFSEEGTIYSRIKIINEIFNSYIIKKNTDLSLETMQALGLRQLLMQCVNRHAFKYLYPMCELCVTKDDGILSFDTIRTLELDQILMQCISDGTLKHVYPVFELCITKLPLDVIRIGEPYKALNIKGALIQCAENHPEYIYPICGLFITKADRVLSLQAMKILKLDQILIQCTQRHPEYIPVICKLCVTRESAVLSLEVKQELKIGRILRSISSESIVSDILKIYCMEPDQQNLYEAIKNDDIRKAKKIIQKWKNLDLEAIMDLRIDQCLQKACSKLQGEVIIAILDKCLPVADKALTLDVIKALGISQCIENILFTVEYLDTPSIKPFLKKYEQREDAELIAGDLYGTPGEEPIKFIMHLKSRIISEIFNLYLTTGSAALSLEAIQTLGLAKVLMRCINGYGFEEYTYFICALCVTKESGFLSLEAIQGLELDQALMQYVNKRTFEYIYPICELCTTKASGVLSFAAIQKLRLDKILMQCVNDRTLEYVLPVYNLCRAKADGVLSLEVIQLLKLDQVLLQCTERYVPFIYELCATKESEPLSLEAMQTLKLDQVISRYTEKNFDCMFSMYELCITKESGSLSLEAMRLLKLDQALLQCIKQHPERIFTICKLCQDKASGVLSLEAMQVLRLDQVLLQCVISYRFEYVISICALCTTKESGLLSLEAIKVLKIQQVLRDIFNNEIPELRYSKPIMSEILRMCGIKCAPQDIPFSVYKFMEIFNQVIQKMEQARDKK